MSVFKKKTKDEEIEHPKAKAEVVADKAEDVCVEEGCSEKKAPGQTYVCQKHIRAG
jgi:hypothetical protein